MRRRLDLPGSGGLAEALPRVYPAPAVVLPEIDRTLPITLTLTKTGSGRTLTGE